MTVETIKHTEIAIIATANNNRSLDVWVDALNKAKAKIERHFKKTARPWFATISSTGTLNIETISPDAFTKRSREGEGQESPRKS